VIEFVEVFSALMALSSRLAMSQATSEERAQLVSILDRYDPNSETGQIRNVMSDFMAASIDIHQNLVLRLIGNGLRSQLVGRLEAIDSDQTLDQALILAMRNAIESNDANLLATTVIKHFDNAKLRLINLIDASTSAQTGFVRNDL
jgi:DNA-binding GntR family transcriptional regulator